MSANNSFLNSKYKSNFSPQNLPGLTIWLDAADSNTVTQSGGVVSYWRDKSPNGIDVSQNTVASRPTYESNVQNGRPSLRFTTAQTMRSTSNFTIPPDQTWFLSYRTFAGGGKFFLEQGPDTNTTDGNYFYGNNGDLFAVKRGAGLRSFYDSAGALADGTWYIASLVNSNLSTTAANDIFWNVNGTTRGVTFRTSTLLSGNATNQLNINVRVPSSNYMGEIIVYNRALSRGEVRLTERYLADKWGISLPTAHPYKTVPSAMRPFNPLDISSCSLWLDAADYSTLTLSGSNVTQWNDKSGNSNHASQATSARQPTYANDTVSFVRANSNFMSLPNAAYWSSNNPLSIVMVMAPTGSNSTNVFLFQGVVATNAGFGLYTTGTAFADYWQGSGANSWGIMTLNTKSILSYIYTQSTNIFAYKDGAGGLLRTQGAYTVNVSNATLGAEVERSFYSDSQINEVIVYSRTLTAQQRQQVELYLAEKWNLRPNLSTANPLRLYESLSPVFSPVLISNCMLWLDAADPLTVTLSGSNATQWNDKSGNGANAVSQGTGPVYSAISNALLWTGSQNMRGTATQLHNATTGNWSAFAVATTTNMTLNLLLNYDVTPNRVAQFLRITTSSNIESISFTNTGGVVSTLTAAAVPLNTRFLAGAVNTSSNVTAYLNGTAGTPTSHGTNITTANTNYSVGVYQELPGSYIGNYWNGQICEIIVYSRNLDSGTRQLLEGYLAWKWNLAGSLANTHPYKTTPV